METKSGADDSKSPPSSPLENLAKQVDGFRTIIAAVVVTLGVAFGAGILWQRMLIYEQRANNFQVEISAIKEDLSDLKRNLSKLSDPSYQIEVTASDDPNQYRCEEGNVVTGVRFDSKRMWIRCASLGRAAYNPDSAAK